mgnify:CR=1 FL=1
MDADTMKEADNIALECGKFLVDQILKNTDDSDKLIKIQNNEIKKEELENS